MQDEVFDFLGDAANYPGGVRKVERIDTHGAVVFLAGAYAYKMKRAVKLGYLDYSTLEKRREMCLRELEINRLTAPEIYLDVLPVTRTTEGELALDRTGTPVEWLVRMRRFDQNALLMQIAGSGKLGPERVNILAGRIAAYHQGAERHKEANGFHKIERIARSLASSFSGAHQLPESARAQDFISGFGAELASQRSHLSARGRQGYIRRCHGDMHLGNIVLLDEVPTLFDAIEFDDDIAIIDILYDVAFLLMDLWQLGLRDQANQLFNEYLRCLNDDGNWHGLVLLPLYLSCRAAIRAMTGIDRLDHVAGDGRAECEAGIVKYLGAAGAFLQRPEPVLILIGGISGTGKSTLGRALSPWILPAPGAVHLRSDVERKALFGHPPEVRLELECYAEHYSDQVYDRLAKKAADILAAGHSVVVDAVFLGDKHRRQFLALAEGGRVGLKPVWLGASEETLYARVAARKNDASDADVAVVEAQTRVKTAPTDWIELDAGGTPEMVFDNACRALGISQ